MSSSSGPIGIDPLSPKSNERLDNMIKKLKSHLISDDKAMETSILLESKENNEEVESPNMKNDSDDLDNESNLSCGMEEDKSLSKSYLMWENNANLCWLDSSMSLLVHSKTILNSIGENSSQIAKIVKGYDTAISIFNDYSSEGTIEDRLQKAKDILKKVQETVLDYLKPILKCKEGEPDSAFCSLLNLISEDKQIKNLFSLEFSWLRSCVKCAIPRVKNNKKTIITLSRVKKFNPLSPVSLYKCPICDSPDQEMEIKYKTLPQCLIFHFENGAGEGEFDSLDFQINDRKYKLSGLITLETSRDKSVSHFVTWVRDIATDSWLECNDLNTDILSFGVVPPLINLPDLYIAMYEALDEKGTTLNLSEGDDQAVRIDTDDTNSSDIPIINLSDEEDGTKFNQNDQTEKGVSDTMNLGGLIKHDETDYDGDAKKAKWADEVHCGVLSSETETSAFKCPDSSRPKDILTKETVTAGNLYLQENASLISREESNDMQLIDVSSNPLELASQSDIKNDKIESSLADNCVKETEKKEISEEKITAENLYFQENPTNMSREKSDNIQLITDVACNLFVAESQSDNKTVSSTAEPFVVKPVDNCVEETYNKEMLIKEKIIAGNLNLQEKVSQTSREKTNGSQLITDISSNPFENKSHTDSKSVEKIEESLEKLTNNSVKETFVEDNTIVTSNSTIKLSNVDVNENLVSSMHQAGNLNNESALASSLKPNKQLNESQKITESDPFKETNKQKLGKYKENQSSFPKYELQVKNPFLNPFVQLSRMSESEINKHVAGKGNLMKPKQSESLEDLTKTVVVKVEQTDPKSIFLAAPSSTAKIEPIRKSSRISARQLKKPIQETLPKENTKFEVVNKNNISSKRRQNMPQILDMLPEIAEKSLETQHPPKKANKTHSASEVHTDDSSGTNTKKPSDDSSANKNVKCKNQRSNIIEKGNHSKATSLNQKAKKKLDIPLSLPENPGHEIAADKIEASVGVSQSSNMDEQQSESEDSENGDKIVECPQSCECKDLQLHELIESTTNCVLANVFHFFNFRNMDL